MGLWFSLCNRDHWALVPLLLVLHSSVPQTSAQGYHNVSLGSSLKPLGPNSSWLSPSGDFAFGFLPFQGNFMLAIWFAKIPNKTMVWYANKIPLQIGSILEFTNDGRLVLTDHANTEVWAVNATTKVSHGAMLDTGNFVLLSEGDKEEYVWQSFDNPTDTILPTQILSQGTNLISHLTDTDFSVGRFKLSVQIDGNLVLYLLAMPITDIYSPSQQRDTYTGYWATGKLNSTKLVFDNFGNVYMAQKDGSTYNVTSGSVSTKDFYQRATLEPDGVFRHYRYLKNVTSREGGGWPSDWSLAEQIPDNICRVVVSNFGTGACGLNAICTMANQRPICTCTPWYSFIDPNRQYLGCMPNFVPQSCEANLSARVDGYEIVQIEETNWPYSDYEQLTNVNEATCRDECLKDCFCAVAIYSTTGVCWKKLFPFRNGLSEPGLDRKALLKISRVNTSNIGGMHPAPCRSTTDDKDRKVPIAARSLLLGSSAVVNGILVLCILLLFYYIHKRRARPQQSVFSMLEQYLRPFTFKELEEATNGFKESLGKGSFGTVYKGTLSKNSNIQVAVKKLDKWELDQEAENEFANEVRAIGQTHHRNLVRLLGFCNEGPHRLLVYEFMSRGSLTSLLFGSFRPNWNQRAQIAYGIAKGLLYLHDDCNLQIIHCDVKPQNVLLDDYLVPKISDFGLAKLLMADQTRTATGIRGTRGYVAPEWFKSMPISAKVDVYSFGVMLLEIICCRKNVEFDSEEDAKAILTDWAYDCYKHGRLDVLVGHSEDVIIDMRRLEKFVMIALWCIQEDPSLRPSMKKVVQMLEGAVEVYVPPDPSSLVSAN